MCDERTRGGRGIKLDDGLYYVSRPVIAVLCEPRLSNSGQHSPQKSSERQSYRHSADRLFRFTRSFPNHPAASSHQKVGAKNGPADKSDERQDAVF
jgi:hypothetical protein